MEVVKVRVYLRNQDCVWGNEDGLFYICQD